MFKLNRLIIVGIITVFVSALGVGLVGAQDDDVAPATPDRQSPVVEYILSLGLTLEDVRTAAEGGLTWQELIINNGGDVESLRSIVLQQASERFDEMLNREIRTRGDRMDARQQLRELWQQHRGNMRPGMPFGGRGGN